MNSVDSEWRCSPDNIKLGNDEFHVWKASLDEDGPTTLELSALLTPEERQRAEKYIRATDRDRFVITRGILRKILSAYVHIAPSDLRFTYNEYGKPELAADQNRHSLSFNLSHSNRMALYAIARGRRVGVDVEYIRTDFPTLDIAEHFFSEDEVRSLKTIPTDLRIEAFFNCWSRKESYIKAIGMGVSFPLDRFTVSLAPDAAPALLKVDADECEPARWQMYELKVGEGYAASSIVENPPVALKQWQWIG